MFIQHQFTASFNGDGGNLRVHFTDMMGKHLKKILQTFASYLLLCCSIDLHLLCAVFFFQCKTQLRHVLTLKHFLLYHLMCEMVSAFMLKCVSVQQYSLKL